VKFFMFRVLSSESGMFCKVEDCFCSGCVAQCDSVEASPFVAHRLYTAIGEFSQV
jgi:hypothetical protein